MRLKAVFILCALALVAFTSCSKKDDNKITSLLPANVRYIFKSNGAATASVYLNRQNTTWYGDPTQPDPLISGEPVHHGDKIDVSVTFQDGGELKIYIGNDYLLVDKTISGKGSYHYTKKL